LNKSISTTLSSANIALVMEILERTPKELERLGATVAQERFDVPLGDGERSLTQDVAHLLNSEARTSEAIYLALLADEPQVADVHPEREFGKLVRLDLLPFPELLAYFKLRRTVLLRVLSGLTVEQWALTMRESNKKRQESVYWKARSLALHEREHVEDLRKLC
jgi:hypothetical protein